METNTGRRLTAGWAQHGWFQALYGPTSSPEVLLATVQ